MFLVVALLLKLIINCAFQEAEKPFDIIQEFKTLIQSSDISEARRTKSIQQLDMKDAVSTITTWFE